MWYIKRMATQTTTRRQQIINRMALRISTRYSSTPIWQAISAAAEDMEDAGWNDVEALLDRAENTQASRTRFVNSLRKAMP